MMYHDLKTIGDNFCDGFLTKYGTGVTGYAARVCKTQVGTVGVCHDDAEPFCDYKDTQM